MVAAASFSKDVVCHQLDLQQWLFKIFSVASWGNLDKPKACYAAASKIRDGASASHCHLGTFLLILFCWYFVLFSILERLHLTNCPRKKGEREGRAQEGWRGKMISNILTSSGILRSSLKWCQSINDSQTGLQLILKSKHWNIRLYFHYFY